MTQFNTLTQKPLAELYDAIDRNKTNPSAIMKASLEALDEIMEGTVKFVDPTNPTIMLWESCAIATAAAVNENVALLRLQYPSLAESAEELYHHMSDWDYANRFAAPGTATIGFLMGLTTLMNDMVRDEAEKCKKAVIPKDTEVIVGDITFTLQYPIVIRYHDTGTISVSYDVMELSPFQTLETNFIAYEPRMKPDGIWFLYFQIPMLQLKIEMVTNTLQAGRVFKMQVPFTDQFFYARAFIRNAATSNRWKEIATTHSDLVYDRRTPTVVLKVEGNTLNAVLPQLYTMDGTLLGDIKLHVYTTKGGILENLEPYSTKIELRALDPEKDLTVYTTESLNATPRQAITNSILTGGTDGLSFEKLRQRVIYNSIGPQVLPITSSQLQAAVENEGFELIKNTDMVTNRIFLATQNLSKPSNPRLLTAANIGIETFLTDKEAMKNHPFVYINENRWTLTPKNLFVQENGVLRMLSATEIQDLQFMEVTRKVNHLNENKYLFTPFHSVFDNNAQEFSLRSYYLDKPKLSSVNFIRQNQSLQLAVNTTARWIKRTTQGYQLSIRVLSGNFYKALPDSQVSAQVMFFPKNEKIPVFIKGYQSNVPGSEEREFSFDFVTNYDIDDSHNLRILNGELSEANSQDVWIDLNTEIHIFLCTVSKTTGFITDESQNLFGAFQLPAGSVPITHESVKMSLGYYLKNLWSRARNLTVGYDYETYSDSVPLTYDRDVYRLDPVTGRIFTITNGAPVFTVEHHFGDPVLDHEGLPVIKHRKGDAIIDHVTGNPVLKGSGVFQKEVDLLFIDGRHYFVNDQAYTDYNQELIDLLVSWIVVDLASVQTRLLEQTGIYYYPKSQIGLCAVDRGDGVVVNIFSEQSPTVDLYVPSSVFKDKSLRLKLTEKTISILDEHLSFSEINNSDTEASLREAYGTGVTSVKLYGLGGDYDLHYAKVISKDKRLSLKRVLEIQSDGTLIMKEDIKINFFEIER